uniref:Uncharacterized protein n=1 Tax=Panagrolaimus sp. JU765 TaxID=591449 RepID=A0AC34Q4C0_9BILA
MDSKYDKPYVFMTNSKNNRIQFPLKNGKITWLDLKAVYPHARALFLSSNDGLRLCPATGNVFYPPGNDWKTGELYVVNENESINDLPYYSNKVEHAAVELSKVQIEENEMAVNNDKTEQKLNADDEKHVEKPAQAKKRKISHEPRTSDPKQPRMGNESIYNKITWQLELLKESPAFASPSWLNTSQNEEFLKLKDLIFKYLPKTLLQFGSEKYRTDFLWRLRGLLLNPRNFHLQDIDPKQPKHCTMCDNEEFTIKHVFKENHLKLHALKHFAEPKEVGIIFCRIFIKMALDPKRSRHGQ